MRTASRNNPIATVIKNYTNKKSGKVTDARNEILRRFFGLDWKDQKRIMAAFLDSGVSDRNWAYSRLLDLWDASFEPQVQALWETYHEEKCAWVIIRHFPKEYLREHIDDFEETKRFAADAYDGEISGIHAFCHSDIFAAVYSTNLLMRVCDVLVTKPGELAFYPVPKLLIKRVGGHEAWGAVRSAEIGDGTYECSSPGEISAALSLIQNDQGIVEMMCENIRKARECGIYDGAYNAVKAAINK